MNSQIDDINKLQPAHSHSFIKGITLQQYMKNTKIQINQQIETHQQDLYTLCKLNPIKKNKLITFAINQIDQDNYQDQCSQQLLTKQQTLVQDRPNALEKSERKNIRLLSIDNKGQDVNQTNYKDFRIKNQSKSPTKSQKKQMFRSLYGNPFNNGAFNLRPSQPSIFASTIHNKFFLKHNNNNYDTNRKQTQFKQKNKKHYNQLTKYQNIVRNKYLQQFDMVNMRIEGIKDRLCQRKIKKH